MYDITQDSGPPSRLPAVLDVVRANTDVSPVVLQTACILHAAPAALPPLPSIARALWEAILDGTGPLAPWLPRGAELRCCGDDTPPEWRAVVAVVVQRPTSADGVVTVLCSTDGSVMMPQPALLVDVADRHRRPVLDGLPASLLDRCVLMWRPTAPYTHWTLLCV